MKDELIVTLFKDLNKDNSEVLLPGLFDVVLDFTEDLAKQSRIFDQFTSLLPLAKTSIKSEWFEFLSKHKDSDSPTINYWLGFCHYYGIWVALDKHKAFKSWELSANQGYAIAQDITGGCYHQGQGVEKDLEIAFYWFTLAADQGYASAQCNVGYCYNQGHGVEKNFEKAFHRFKLAADQGHARAQYAVGHYYHDGKFVEKNFEEAMKWSCKAANQSSKKQIELLSSLWNYR